MSQQRHETKPPADQDQIKDDNEKRLKHVWKNPKFIARAQELIESGILVKESAEALRTKLNEEFFPDDQRKISKRVFERHLGNLIWSDKKRTDLLSSHVKYDLPLESAYQLLSYLPKMLVDKKAKELRGRSPRSDNKKKTNEIFEAGVGRLVTDEEVARGVVNPLKQYTMDSPFELSVRDKERFSVLPILPHIGTQYDRRIDHNPVRNMIRHAERVKIDAIILPGALLWTDLAMSGKLLAHRAELSSFDLDEDVIRNFLDPDYRDKALEIKRTLPPDKMVFVTLREFVVALIHGAYRKLMLHKDGTPIFSGKIYILFGPTEWNLIVSASAAHVTHIMRSMFARAVADRRAAQVKRAYVVKAKGEDSPEAEELIKEIERLTKEEQRYRVMNADKKERQRITDIVTSLLIQWFKEAVPNSEFVARGDAVCSVGGKDGKLISVVQVHDEKATDNALARRVEGAGIRELAGRLPDVELLAGAYNLNMRYSTREHVQSRERRVTHIVQLPVAIDREFVRSALGNIPKSVTPYERLVFDARFEPGALHLQYVNGLWVFCKLSLAMFKTRHVLGMHNSTSTPYIYVLFNGDVHTGSRSQIRFFDGVSGEQITLELGISRILLRNFKRGKLPIHGFVDTGDQVQGHHFQTQQGVHPHQRSLGDEQARVRELLNKTKKITDPAELREMLRELAGDQVYQLAIRGEDWPVRQIIDHMRHSLRERAELFLEILKAHRRAKIKLTGIGEAEPEGRPGIFDARDTGAINELGGNHLENTTNKEITEGPIFACYIIARLLGLPGCDFSEDELERLVRAPLWGDIPLSYGLWSVTGEPHSYTWGLQIRHDPARKSKQNADPLLNELKNVIEAGDYPGIFGGKEWIGGSGDVHRIGAAWGPGVTLVSCGSGTRGDHYGAKHGFSRSTAGAVVVGIPAWGPASGPIKVIPFTHDFVKRYLEKPWEIDWNSVFPKPAGL